MTAEIQIRGAREHNLCDLYLSLPARRLIAITGVSGSGKSSLAFDTVFREGQRRFLRSFSAHARQYLGRLERAKVESITGLGPALCLEQRPPGASPRSTVGTLSGIGDHLRLLFARVGIAPCPACGAAVDGLAHAAGGRRTCPACGHDHPAPDSSLLSFNIPAGACPACKGLGVEDWVDPALLVADPTRSLRQGALVPTTPSGYIVYSQVTMDVLDQVCRAHGFDVDTPWQELSTEQRRVVFFGSSRVEVPFGKHPLQSRLRWSGITARPREMGHYRGIVPTIEEIVRRDRNRNAMRFARSRPCTQCGGARLRPEALAITFRGRSIADLSALTVEELRRALQMDPPERAGPVASPILERVGTSLALLSELGLDHLSLDRPTDSLSGGEAQRVRLATLAGGGLGGLVYVMDEPSAGLHGKDIRKLQRVLARLRERGNTVLVVEHDLGLVASADWLVDIGPGPGSSGGRLLFAGPPAELADPERVPPGAKASVTRGFLIGERRLRERSTEPRPGQGLLVVRGARKNNLRSVDATFRLGALNLVTGVSGSGKSSLVMQVLAEGLRRHLGSGSRAPEDHDAIEGAQALDKIVCIDQAPIGRTPRSNPATYTGLFDRIRALLAATHEARELGFGKGRFSFNNRSGRCEACQGAGVQTIGMHFLGDVAIRCEECGGRRFDPQTLQVKLHDHNVAELLDLSVHQALELFSHDPALARKLRALSDLGLGYLALGQPSTTLSGGEAQRVKLATELARPSRGRTIYLLDEPSTGLHDQDLVFLLAALDELVEAGNTVVAIEHHLGLIGCADWVVDLGPGGGARGGCVVAQCTPRELMDVPASATGQMLLEGGLLGEPAPAELPAAGHLEPIRLRGVRTHNLQSVDVTIPSGRLTVITGVSGSGKSSLAFDTLHAEGQRRLAEVLSPFARRFMEQLPRPLLDEASGLTPTVGISRQTLAPNPRSTVSTLLELYDLYRLIYARAGTPHCPGCGEQLTSDTCAACGERVQLPLSAAHFSFNHHSGSCPACRGLGLVKRADPDKLVTDPRLPLTGGALDGSKTGRHYGEPHGQYVAILREVGQALGHDFDLPYGDLPPEAQRVAMRGTGEKVYHVVWRYDRKGRRGEHRFERTWPGFLTLVDAEYDRKHADRRGEAMEAVLSEGACETCKGERLQPAARSVRFAGKTIGELCELTTDEALSFFSRLDGGGDVRPAPLSPRLAAITADARKGVGRILSVLSDLGLGYVTAARRASSLSGGEARRLQMAAVLGSGLRGITYVLDEPTIGLHPSDTRGLLRILQRLRDLGNTVVLVEHDLEVIRNADLVVELGPGAGSRGGKVVAAGTVASLARSITPTGRALAAEARLGSAPGERRPLLGGLSIRGARANNLLGLDLDIPSGGLVAICGVSGSGKSTLVDDVIWASAVAGRPVACDSLQGLCAFDRVARVDPSPLGQSPSSNPATYSGLFDRIRALFAATDAAQEAGFTKGRFSFLGKAGRCPRCRGHGSLRVPMGFLADVWVTCDQCEGARYNPETLAVRWRDHSIADVLDLTMSEAAALFAQDRRLAAGLGLFEDVGLGYLRLGQPATTLSGGESKRVKLVTELLGARPARRGRAARREEKAKSEEATANPRRAGKTLYLLDEPTTGLAEEDVTTLLRLLSGLCDAGHTILVVEHNLQVLRSADWIIDLGPGAGPDGGRLVAQGTPERVAAVPASATGREL